MAGQSNMAMSRRWASMDCSCLGQITLLGTLGLRTYLAIDEGQRYYAEAEAHVEEMDCPAGRPSGLSLIVSRVRMRDGVCK
jgi:hypothetical protein